MILFFHYLSCRKRRIFKGYKGYMIDMIDNLQKFFIFFFYTYHTYLYIPTHLTYLKKKII